MKTLSLEMRERILAAFDAGKNTREQIARRFRVSTGMVKKLIQQRRETGDIGPRHHLSGRKPTILPAHRDKLRSLLAKNPDLTLAQLRSALGLACSLPAIHFVLADLGLTSKERHAAGRRPAAKRPGKPAARKPVPRAVKKPKRGRSVSKKG